MEHIYGEEIPAGPWDDEPDKVQWIDGDTDLDCLAVRNHMGAWCGYVGVPRTHPYYRTPFDHVPVSVHGGLTFSNTCDEDAPEGHGICHIPLPGRSDDVWWLGFDCGHFTDVQPALAAMFGRFTSLADTRFEPRYRTLEYVQRECADLAKQLAGGRIDE